MKGKKYCVSNSEIFDLKLYGMSQKNLISNKLCHI